MQARSFLFHEYEMYLTNMSENGLMRCAHEIKVGVSLEENKRQRLRDFPRGQLRLLVTVKSYDLAVSRTFEETQTQTPPTAQNCATFMKDTCTWQVAPCGGALSVSGLLEPITFTLTVEDPEAAECVVWDEEAGAWSTDGLEKAPSLLRVSATNLGCNSHRPMQLNEPLS
eukprot:6487727-Amphidinium_carterae.1